jgi:hypothetical protein
MRNKKKISGLVIGGGRILKAAGLSTIPGIVKVIDRHKLNPVKGKANRRSLRDGRLMRLIEGWPEASIRASIQCY